MLSAPEIQYPVVIEEGNPLFGWEFEKDSWETHTSIIEAVQFQSWIQDLSTQLKNQLPQYFAGIHLRVEDDAPWFKYDEQVATFIGQLDYRFPDIKTVYVAVGDKKWENKFRDEMNNHNITVISKWSLAQSNSTLYKKLSELRFDVLAAVDYEIIIESKFFFGLGLSSFTYAVAFQRGNGNISLCNCALMGPVDDHFTCCY
ncbi:MAG: hypothetical protein EOP34_09840 [Rickettsiales bacterium]|nr:MAG: hypothetical protein EOP34_09840 [Rickettsiales bacterium]